MAPQTGGWLINRLLKEHFFFFSINIEVLSAANLLEFLIAYLTDKTKASRYNRLYVVNFTIRVV